MRLGVGLATDGEHLVEDGGKRHMGGREWADERIDERAAEAGDTIHKAPDRAQDAHLDFGRERRTGIPEIILAGVKTDEQVLRLARSFVETSGRALLTRLRTQTLNLLEDAFADCH